MKKFSFVLSVVLGLTCASNVLAQSSSGGSPCADEPQKSVTIEFAGLTAVTESDMRKYLREEQVNKSFDSGLNSASIAKAETAIKNLLSDYGYRHAAVSSWVEQGANESQKLRFMISEGPRFTISEIRFEGNRIFAEQLLTTKMKACLARYQEDDARIFRSDVFEYCSRGVIDFERSQGYLQARFGEPKIEEAGEGLTITINSQEGPIYRLGQIEIEGADHVAGQDIRQMLDIRTGDIANGQKIAKTLFEDLKEVYGEKGFIRYTAEIEPVFHAGAANGVVDFKIFIDEGRRFRIRKILFTGDNLPESDLRQLVMLRAGEVYNQKLFEESVKRINETGWFNDVDKGRDVDFRTNEEEGLVDVTIKITKRQDVSRSGQ